MQKENGINEEKSEIMSDSSCTGIHRNNTPDLKEAPNRPSTSWKTKRSISGLLMMYIYLDLWRTMHSQQLVHHDHYMCSLVHMRTPDLKCSIVYYKSGPHAFQLVKHLYKIIGI